MTRFARPAALALSVALLVFILGCATARVEVDVYKGPLANHEHVQTQQMAVMAIGAKPILIELRDRMEWGNKAREKRTNKNDPVYDWYRAGYVKPLSVGDRRVSFFENERAIRVNAILGLYEEQGDPRLAKLIEGGVAAADNYGEAFAVVRPKEGSPQNKEDIDSWDRFSRAMLDEVPTDAYEFRNYLIGLGSDDGSSGDQRQENIVPGILILGFRFWNLLGFTSNRVPNRMDLNESLKQLKEAYKGFIEGSTQQSQYRWRHQDGIFEIHDKLRLDIRTWFQFEDEDPLASEAANKQFRLLHEGALVQDHANLLFGPTAGANGRIKQEFVEYVRGIASSFLAARQELESVLSNALEALAVLPEYESPDHLTALRGREFAAKIATLALSPYQLSLALTTHPFNDDPDVKRLAKLIKEKFGNFDYLAKISRRDLRYRETMRNLFVNEGRDVAELFLYVHTRYRGLSATEEGEVSRYGLTAGPTTDLSAGNEEPDWIASDSVELLEQARGLQRAAALALERGRLQKGLEPLIEEYLAATVERPNPDPERVTQLRNRLFDALVRFSEKLLIIADNDVLLDPRGPFQEFRDRLRALEETPAGGSLNDVEDYVLVLQAIGNSILVQADELTYRKAHANGVREGAAREIRSLQAALRATPKKVMEDVLRELNARLATAQAEQDAATNADEEARTKLGDNLDTNAPYTDDELRNLNLNTLRQTRDAAHESAQEFLDAYAIIRETTIAGGSDEATPYSKIRSAIKDDPDVNATKDAVRTTLIRLLEKQETLAAARGTSRADQLGNYLNLVRGIDIETLSVPPPSDKEAILGAIESAATSSLANAVRDRNAAQANYDNAQAAKKAYEERVAKTSVASNLKDAVDKIRAANTATKGDERYSRDPIAAINQWLDEESKKAAAADKSKYKHAKTQLAAVRPADSLTLPVDFGDGAKDTREVLDELIETLEGEYILKVREFGKDSQVAKQLADAIKAAYDHRAGMIYIRPASSYLRTSFAATGLQGDPSLAWSNMLGSMGLRNMPFVGGLWHNWANDNGRDRQRIISEIDKQFWQNINSVKVSGAGNTNYVIAKDDIGNWYVKQYAADPEPIIEGAESLAAFALGGAMETDLLSPLQRLRAGDSAAAAETDTSGPLTKVLARYETEYIDATRQDLAQLISGMEGLNASIQTSWKAKQETWTAKPGVVDKLAELNEAGDAAQKAHLAPALESLEAAQVDEDKALDQIKDIQNTVATSVSSRQGIKDRLEVVKQDIDNPKRNQALVDGIIKEFNVSEDKSLSEKFDKLKKALGAPDQGEKILDGLNALRRFYNNLKGGIGSIDFAAAPAAAQPSAEEVKKNTDEVKKDATEIARNATRDLADKLLTRRDQVIDLYEEKIVFLGEAASI